MISGTIILILILWTTKTKSGRRFALWVAKVAETEKARRLAMKLFEAMRLMGVKLDS